MADIEYFEDDRSVGATYGQDAGGDRAGPQRLGTIVNWTGAIVSLGLVVGMGVWAFQLTMRDVSGVPVVRALEGPMRVPPADPGGVQADNQGLAVNRIAEGAEAAPVPDQLVLAPAPVDLEEFNLSSASVPEDPPLPTPDAASAETQALIERLLANGDRFDAGPEGEAVPPDDGELSEAGTEVEAQAPATAEVAAGPAIIPASIPGVARSLRPSGRPAALSARAAASRGTPLEEGDRDPVAQVDATLELDPATLDEGTRLVQLGAFDTAEIARSEWDRLIGRFPDFFIGRARIVQAANSGGSTFYRLRAHGFDDLAASRRFCAALMAQSAPCIPVTVR